jgi:hypothetical protein
MVNSAGSLPVRRVSGSRAISYQDKQSKMRWQLARVSWIPGGFVWFEELKLERYDRGYAVVFDINSQVSPLPYPQPFILKELS